MTSKLVQMQARFQQKQMQEKEEKLLKLYENQQQRAFEKVGRGSAGSNSSVGSTGGGKVRQMFDERRQRAGVDKSYPLEPLKSKTAGITNTSRTTVAKSTVRKTSTQKANLSKTSHEEGGQVKSYDTIDSENNLIEMLSNHNLNDLDSEELPEINFNGNRHSTGKLANVGGKLPSQKIDTKLNGAKTESKVVSKKPIAKPTASPPRSSSSVSSASSQSSKNSQYKTDSYTMSRQTPPAPRAPSNQRPSAKQSGVTSPVVRDDLASCRFCGRRFATDRLGVHEDICGKTGKKKRKPYDTTTHRVLGTELEAYVKTGKKASKAVSSKTKKMSAPNSNWRRTHEEFIAAIRAAKQAQAHVAKGGKLSDLPPPPPSTNPDYVQCPHCGRRFNESAAQRHIPKCASYDFNKPKPKARK
ncbi:unnamed protein product [Ceutorhynchus assimilis]|uniref:C2HC/C3H-type domain-containing protein n=1 Tax=Ceutorhynchus assimilis TaxID=467358 RepID=A0A9P0DHJ7_9CUCU|nr:unnamed protein product [Ceutorhynchus assimilis]